MLTKQQIEKTKHKFQAVDYYKTYYDFSEKTRDNNLKLESLLKLSENAQTFLEIGPGPGCLVNRMIKNGKDVHIIDNSKEMINELLKNVPPGYAEKVIHADINSHNFKKKYDVIYVEGGFFLFTKLKNDKIVFECFEDWDKRGKISNTLAKIYDTINKNGLYLIGVQDIFDNVNFGKDYKFSMNRRQHKNHATRNLQYFKNDHLFLEYDQKRLTMPYEEFVTFAKEHKFKDVKICEKKQWVILYK